MMITLNDVSTPFHIPLAGSFFTTPHISQELAHMGVVHGLGVTHAHVIYEFRFNIGAHFRLSYLRDRYVDIVHQGMYEASARVYMLHLVGCTILADKSHVYINMKYMWLFSFLEHCSWA